MTEPLKFILAGKSTFTLHSLSSGRHFTYKLKQKGDMYFAYLLTGPDNESDFTYLGMLVGDRLGSGWKLITTTASKLAMDSLPTVALRWVIERLASSKPIEGVEILPSGRCGRCGRKLTTPESLANGLGPECANR